MKSTIDDLRKYRNLVLVVFVFCMISTLSFLAARNMTRSSAASLSGFKPGNIISDAVMGNYNSMTKDEIQAFLTKKNPCNNTSVSQYQSLKKQYPNLDWHFENGHFVCLSEEKFGDDTVIGQGQTAAEIIYQAAQDYRINPQVLIVLLQKEQSLITDTYPNTRQYRSATGYGCPDTAACDTKYYGFKNQVRNAAALFRNVLDNGYYAYPEKKSGVYIGYNPSSSCGRSEVYIENRATAALYRYTPYQPNAAALSAGYGAGDGCSAYGNRNFYLYFTDWFGSTQESIQDSYKVNLSEGQYGFVTTVNSQRYAFDVPGLQKTAGTNIWLWSQYAQGAQRWKVAYNSATQDYTITDINSGLNLSAASESATSGTKLQIAKPASSCAQRWKIYQPSNNDLVFESACARGMVISATSENITNGTSLALTPYSGSNTQLWHTYIGQTIKDGDYKIQTALNQKLVLDVAGLKDSDGANIQLWEDYYGGFQNWHLMYEASSDSYILTNIETGKALESTGASTQSGSNIQTWHEYGTCGHRWKIIANTDNTTYTLMSTCKVGQVLDLAGAKTDFGTNIQLWSANNATNQKWKFKASNATSTVKEGIYTLTTKAKANRAIDVMGLQKNDGANVWLWEQYAQGAQKWKITYNKSTNDYTLTDVNSGKALATTQNNGRMGNNIILSSATTSGNCTTRWRFTQTSNGYYKITSSCLAGRVVDITGAKTDMGTNIWLWEDYNQPAQEWKLTLVK